MSVKWLKRKEANGEKHGWDWRVLYETNVIRYKLYSEFDLPPLSFIDNSSSVLGLYSCII